MTTTVGLRQLYELSLQLQLQQCVQLLRARLWPKRSPLHHDRQLPRILHPQSVPRDLLALVLRQVKLLQLSHESLQQLRLSLQLELGERLRLAQHPHRQEL